MEPKILVVDDELDNIKLIRDYLSDIDAEIIEAHDGIQGWEILEKSYKEINLVLLDRMMPKMDGMEVMAKVKQHPDISKIPVIMQTAAGTSEEIKQGVRAGVHYYLLKPYDDDMLIALVTAALMDYETSSRLQQELFDYKHTLQYMESCELSFKTLSDAQFLSSYVANFYPNPGKVVVGISEIFVNAVEHGNLGVTFDEKSELLETNSWAEEIEKRQGLPEYSNRRVQVSFVKNESKIILSIEDEGDGFKWQDYFDLRPNALLLPHGRGIYMCKTLYFDELDYNDKGNKVNVTTYLND
jgi:CheY-like chemotaxis protein/anti-sigma regulatory factor (Ser/Thr protein kinase)